MSHSTLGEELIYHGRVFDVVKVHVRLPNEKERSYDLVKHHGAVTIVPLDHAGNIWFVHQYRIGAGETLLELPAGLLEEEEAPEDSAAREVQEEIGMAAGKIEMIGEFYMVPGYSTEKLTAYLATGLYDSALPGDDDEFLERVAIPAGEVFSMIRAGEMRDGKTLAALLLALPRLAHLPGVMG